MTLQNRVNPEGDICIVPERGTLMGNRGCLHDSDRKIVSNSKRDAWVTCLLQFQNRKRSLMTPGSYTELFFLDEVTALAAGHRPCATCRRDRYYDFLVAWSAGNRNGANIGAGEVDKQLKLERARSARVQVQTLKDLPDGVIVKQMTSGEYFLVRDAKALPWSFVGYGRESTSVSEPFLVLTPASVINTFRHGYKPEIHPTATTSL